METLCVAGFQVLAPSTPCSCREDVEKNVARIADRIREEHQKNSKPRLYILPELSSFGYCDKSFEQISELAEKPEKGFPSFDAFSAVAKELGVYILYGFANTIQTNKFCISVAILNDSGELVTVYNKNHLWGWGGGLEDKYFVPGTSLSTFELDGFKFGLSICFDLRFPSLFREYAMTHGVDAIIHSSAFPADSLSISFQSFAITRGLENQVYFLVINQAGKEWAPSIVVPPWISQETRELKIESQEELVFHYTLSRKVIQQVRSEIPLRSDWQPYDYPAGSSGAKKLM